MILSQHSRKFQTEQNSNLVRIVFDFAEKALLPSFTRQPGSLHFITGLRFDLFGGSCSKLRTNVVFGLPEGHCPGDKTADTVLSMLNWVLYWVKNSERTASCLVLRLHADNCSS